MTPVVGLRKFAAEGKQSQSHKDVDVVDVLAAKVSKSVKLCSGVRAGTSSHEVEEVLQASAKLLHIAICCQS